MVRVTVDPTRIGIAIVLQYPLPCRTSVGNTGIHITTRISVGRDRHTADVVTVGYVVSASFCNVYKRANDVVDLSM